MHGLKRPINSTRIVSVVGTDQRQVLVRSRFLGARARAHRVDHGLDRAVFLVGDELREVALLLPRPRQVPNISPPNKRQIA